MDSSYPGRSNTQQSGGFPVGLQLFAGILNWLIGFFQLTEEEQKEVGIYLGDPPSR